MRLRIEFLSKDNFSDFSEASEMAGKIKEHLLPGVYFCVFKNVFGADWWTIDLLNNSEEISSPSPSCSKPHWLRWIFSCVSKLANRLRRSLSGNLR
jgi:hypothetical protein